MFIISELRLRFTRETSTVRKGIRISTFILVFNYSVDICWRHANLLECFIISIIIYTT